jgi:hypothetical protein
MLTPTTLPKSTQNWFPLGACWLTSLLIRCQGFWCGERVIGFVDFYFSFTITTIKSNFHLKCIKPGTFFKFVRSKKIPNFFFKKWPKFARIWRRGQRVYYFLPITIRVFPIFAHWIKVRPPLTFRRHPGGSWMTDGRTDGQTYGWMDGWMGRHVLFTCNCRRSVTHDRLKVPNVSAIDPFFSPPMFLLLPFFLVHSGLTY